VLLAWLIGGHLLLRDIGCNGIIFMNACCYNHCHGNIVKGFWALLDNIYDFTFMTTTLDSPIILYKQLLVQYNKCACASEMEWCLR
jgi:hypothetical protein